MRFCSETFQIVNGNPFKHFSKKPIPLNVNKASKEILKESHNQQIANNFSNEKTSNQTLNSDLSKVKHFSKEHIPLNEDLRKTLKENQINDSNIVYYKITDCNSDNFINIVYKVFDTAEVFDIKVELVGQFKKNN